MESTALVLGLDIGATSTRALIADTEGNRIGSGRGPGANITSHSPERALDAIGRSIDQALQTVRDPLRVRHAVVGTAGDANLRRPEVADAFQRMWHGTGLNCDYDVVADAEVAFVAGTAEPSGTLVLSGTGALVARFEDRKRVRTVDGHGWLLGDRGSGFWLGREAVRVALAALDRLEAPGSLGRAVLRALLPAGMAADTLDPDASPVEVRYIAAQLVMAAHARPPVTLAELAPLVTEHAGQDPEARRVIAGAAAHLLESASLVRATGEDTPIVLAGSLLTIDTPLRDAVNAGIEERWPKAVVSAAADGAAGAAWLAAIALIGLSTPESIELHARLLPGA